MTTLNSLYRYEIVSIDATVLLPGILIIKGSCNSYIKRNKWHSDLSSVVFQEVKVLATIDTYKEFSAFKTFAFH